MFAGERLYVEVVMDYFKINVQSKKLFFKDSYNLSVRVAHFIKKIKNCVFGDQMTLT